MILSQRNSNGIKVCRVASLIYALSSHQMHQSYTAYQGPRPQASGPASSPTVVELAVRSSPSDVFFNLRHDGKVPTAGISRACNLVAALPQDPRDGWFPRPVPRPSSDKAVWQLAAIRYYSRKLKTTQENDMATFTRQNARFDARYINALP